MTKARIYLSSPHLAGNESNYLKRTLSSNWLAPVGPQLNLFEKELCKMLGAKACCLVNSGTAAIELALRVAEIGVGDAVFVQTHTHIGSVVPIVRCGATPIFIDSERDTWNMCPRALEEAIREIKVKRLKLKAVLPVHIYGTPANMDAILSIAKKHKIQVIEDAAESLGSTYLDKQTGTLGDYGMISFNGNKIITTSGGGVLFAKSKKLAKRALFLATQANENAPHFEHKELGYNFRMSNLLAAFGRAQFKYLNERVAQRRANFSRYQSYFQGKNKDGYYVQFQEEAEGSFSNRWLSCILIDPEKNKGITREQVRLALDADNIEARPLWKPMHLQPVFENAQFFGTGVCERLFEIGLCLPSGSNLVEADFNRIFKVLDEVFKS